MICLAGEWAGQPCSVRQLAAREGISAKYLEHIMARLRQAKLVRAVPGHGYRLTKNPRGIRLNRVFRLLEGGCRIAPCRVGGRACLRSRHCPTRRLWRHVEKCLDNCLSKVTLADFYAAGARGKRGRRVEGKNI